MTSIESSDFKTTPVFERAVCEYKNKSGKFIIGTSDYSRQFSHIYTIRLKKMRENLMKTARKKWGTKIPIMELYQLQEERAEELDKCIIIGTLYKQQILKPNILKEISEEHQLELQPTRTQFTDDSDELVLEDELQRIILLGKIDVHSVVTGIVCAVLGHDGQEGKFTVEDYCFVVPQEHVYKPLSGPDRLVVLVSGLGIGGSNAANAALAAELLTEWVCGEAGSEEDQKRFANVVRVVFAGNSLQESSQDRLMSRKLNNIETNTQTALLSNMVLLDEFLVQLLGSVDVDLMPGEFDPCNNMIPQQPLHRCLLPESSRYPTMHSVSNPYKCEVGGCLLLGTSGQPLADMASLCRQEDRLQLLQNSLEWGHISPTSPDTLPCFPCYNEDPFIIDECPDVFFAGNQPKFQTKIFTAPEGQKVRLICIPSFSQTQTCVVLNLNTLDCYPIQFSVPDIPMEH